MLVSQSTLYLTVFIQVVVHDVSRHEIRNCIAQSGDFLHGTGRLGVYK